jgi:hypothetical protein
MGEHDSCVWLVYRYVDDDEDELVASFSSEEAARAFVDEIKEKDCKNSGRYYLYGGSVLLNPSVDECLPEEECSFASTSVIVARDRKLGFFGATPVGRQELPPEFFNVNDIARVLRTYGLIK